MHYTYLDFIKPELMKEVLSAEKSSIFPKAPMLINNYQRVVGNGIAFS